MAPTNPRCTIRTKIDTKAVHINSLSECLRRYIANKKNKILVGTILDVKNGPKATALGRRRNLFVAKFDLNGGDMKVTTINIRSVKLHNAETICPDNHGYGGERAVAATTTTTG